MGGGLMQLVAYGAQDIYLTGNPQITFFKVVYRRHTNFSMEAIEQTVNGSRTLGASASSGTVTISRNGDLISKIYVTSTNDDITKGDELVNEVELEIGGQRIDKHFKEWNQVWNELSTSESKAIGLKAMQGAIGTTGGTGVGMVQVPLNFWFCRNPGLALPLIALQYHEVKLKFTWGTSTIVGAEAACTVVVDYVYLDTDERRRFAQQSHEYLIEQLQRQSETADKDIKLNFNHPVKELIWTTESVAYVDAHLVLNGHERFSKQQEEYFQLRQPFDHHTAIPRQNLPVSARIFAGNSSYTRFVADANAAYAATNLHSTLTAGAVDTNNLINVAGTTLQVGGAGTEGTASIAALPSGTTIALVVTVAPTARTAGGGTDVVAHGVTGTFGGNTVTLAVPATKAAQDNIAPTVGQVFFADVASATAANASHADIVLRTNLTATNGDVINGIVANVDGDTDGADGTELRCRLYIVDNSVGAQARTSQMTRKVNVYSFALKPEEHQPSGTCNFSRIDNARLKFTARPGGANDTINVYAVNYNVLRIMSGMGGLAYSN